MTRPDATEAMQQVVSTPDDDAPRLAFANRIEADMPDRAAFIRWQCALAKHTHTQDAYAYDLGQLIRNAIAPPPRELRSSADFGQKALRHGLSVPSAELDDSWVSSALRDAASACTFRRGFVEGVHVDAASLVSNAEQIFQAAPITHLTLDVPPEWERTESPSALLERVLSLPQFSQVKSLALGSDFGDPSAIAIAQSSLLGRLTHLSFGQRNQLTKVGVEALANSPHLTQLSSLELYRSSVGAAGVEALLSGGLASRIQRLALRDCKAGGKALIALSQAPLPALTHLNLAGNALSAASLKKLPKAAWAPQLETLNIRGNSLANGKLKLLAGGPFLALRALDLAFARLGEGELEALASADLWTGLEELALASNAVGDRDIATIFSQEFGAVLRSLDVDQCNCLGGEAITHITTSPYACHLAQLSISRVVETCAERIAQSPNLADLRVFSVTGSQQWTESAVQTVLKLRGLQFFSAPGAVVRRRDTVTKPVVRAQTGA